MTNFNGTPEPIVVNASPTPAQISAGLRQLILAVGPLVGYLGWSGGESTLNTALQYIGPISAVVAFLWGQLSTRSHAKKASVMATQLPNSIARTK